MKVGILSLGRATFDIKFAHKNLKEIIKKLDDSNFKFIGSKKLLLDEKETYSEIKNLKKNNPTHILILQITFTDASTILRVSEEFNMPISIWAIPEPRTGERLRLNSFCGLNLASHTLGLNKKAFNWLYKDPKHTDANDISNLLNLEIKRKISLREISSKASLKSKKIFKKINEFKIAKIGDRPNGFSTCDYDKKEIKKFCNIKIEELRLKTLFQKSKKIKSSLIKNKIIQLSDFVTHIKNVDQKQMHNSISYNFALNDIIKKNNFNAFAIRCWPETFTEYGGAICSSVSMLTEKNIPCACEADVYGAITQLILQTVSKSQVFLTDIVDIDTLDNTGVLWHCGQAPISMCEPSVKPKATIHTNRKMPLLFEFPLKAGEVTLMRISKGLGKQKMIISSGEILKRDMAFTGTSGIIRFKNHAEVFLNNLIETGLEHHIALAYGNHKDILSEIADCMSLPVIEI